MSLRKILQYIFIVLELLIIVYIIYYFIFGVFPIHSLAFWIAVIIEAGLAYLTYVFWKRSMRGEEYRSDRLKAFGLIAAGFILPALTYYSGIESLRPTGHSELFYISIALGLLLYVNMKEKRAQSPGKTAK